MKALLIVVIAPMIMVLILLKFGIYRYFRLLVSSIKSDHIFGIFIKFRYKETYGTITSENLKYSLTNSLL